MADAKSNTFENDILKLIFNGTAITGIAQDATTPISLYLSLHTSTLSDTSAQNTSECAYGAYDRVAVPRNSTSGWTVTGNAATLQANQDFPEATSGTETATYFAVGTASTGAGKVLYYGTITPNISISTGVTPRLTTGTTISEL